MKETGKPVLTNGATSVRSSVEETLNALLQAEADQICKAGRYERSPERVDTGHYERKLAGC
jgi:putative transposase